MATETEARVAMEPREDDCVYVGDTVDTRYGPKTELGGDTYELLSSHGEGIADALDFHEHHCAWDSDRETWTIDPDGVGALEAAFEERGRTLGGVGARAAEAARGLAGDGHTWWKEAGVRCEVVYEPKGGGDARKKEGVVSSVDPERGYVQFERRDGTLNRVHGNALLAPRSDYPFMGDVKCVVLELE